MIINPNLPSGFVIFCDDVRQEVTGKQTLVGVYSGQMVITGNLPVTLPQICAVTTFRLAPPSEPVAATIRVFKSGQDDPLFEIKVDMPAAKPSDFASPPDPDPDCLKFLQMTLTAQLQGVAITEACTLKVRAFVGEDEIRLGALQILITPPEVEEQASTH